MSIPMDCGDELPDGCTVSFVDVNGFRTRFRHSIEEKASFAFWCMFGSWSMEDKATALQQLDGAASVKVLQRNGKRRSKISATTKKRRKVYEPIAIQPRAILGRPVVTLTGKQLSEFKIQHRKQVTKEVTDAHVSALHTAQLLAT